MANILENNANEGPSFVPPNIDTEDDFVDFLRNTFPLFTNENISQILRNYPSTNAWVSDTPKFATSGTSPPTAVNESTFATGQQQRAYVCFYQRPLSPHHPWNLHILTRQLISKPERLRRVDLRLPFLLASRRLHREQP